MKPVVIIGGGMGGLTAALHLARAGIEVLVVEARAEPGGLATTFETGGLTFDAGPYILLDRPGLDWAFTAVGLNLARSVELRAIEDVYQVAGSGGIVRFHAGVERTAAGFEAVWPGSGRRYSAFVADMTRTYAKLRPLLTNAHPGVPELVRLGAWTEAGFLTRSLLSILNATGLPEPVQQAIAIWTHVAGQPLAEAASPMAFVPALIHKFGCYYVRNGIGSIPAALERAAREAGVRFRTGTRIRRIHTEHGYVCAVETAEGERIETSTVVSNHSAVGTYLDLLDATPSRFRQKLRQLPLQSPGVCAYLAVRGRADSMYLRFQLPERERCRLLISPASLDPALARDGWRPARLLGPMEHAEAERLGPEGQREYLERIIAEPWWRENVEEFRVLETRTPAEWGRQFHLYRDSMNPVMTARFMRQGRFAHRSRQARGLYLAGSSTHPGQWVSFCAISGVLAANAVLEDLGKC